MTATPVAITSAGNACRRGKRLNMNTLSSTSPRRDQLRHKIAVMLTVSAIPLACGGGTSSPVAPTTTAVAPAPTLRTINLNPGSLEIVVGNSATVSATGTFTDGSTRTVFPTWTSSARSFVDIDPSGVLRALAGGSATITATASGVSASMTVRAIPNYAGRWFGQYRFISCAAPPRWGNSYCAGTLGTLYNIELNLGMTGSQVTGSIRLGTYIGSVNGSIGADGSLSLRGRYSATTPSGLVYSEEIRTWQTRTGNGTTMTGRWDTTGLLSGESQTGYNEYEMVSVNKS